MGSKSRRRGNRFGIGRRRTKSTQPRVLFANCQTSCLTLLVLFRCWFRRSARMRVGMLSRTRRPRRRSEWMRIAGGPRRGVVHGGTRHGLIDRRVSTRRFRVGAGRFRDVVVVRSRSSGRGRAWSDGCGLRRCRHGSRRSAQGRGFHFAARGFGWHDALGREIAGFCCCRDGRPSAVVLCQ